MQLYFINFKFNHNYKHDDNLNIEHYLLTFSKLIIKLKYTMLVESHLKLDNHTTKLLILITQFILDPKNIVCKANT